jgi:P27 family predicted phage terminase small subunit
VTPKCPGYLDVRAKQEWRRLVPILKRMKVLTEADGLMLGNLCLAVSTLVRTQEKLNELGILYKSPSGYVMQSPLLGVVNQCVDTITKLSREFGLSPASRARLTIENTDDGTAELMEILSRPRERKTS